MLMRNVYLFLCIYVYVYICIYMYIYMYIFIYLFIFFGGGAVGAFLVGVLITRALLFGIYIGAPDCWKLL